MSLKSVMASPKFTKEAKLQYIAQRESECGEDDFALKSALIKARAEIEGPKKTVDASE